MIPVIVSEIASLARVLVKYWLVPSVKSVVVLSERSSSSSAPSLLVKTLVTPTSWLSSSASESSSVSIKKVEVDTSTQFEPSKLSRSPPVAPATSVSVSPAKVTLVAEQSCHSQVSPVAS